MRIEKRGDWRLDVLRAGKRITGSALGASGYAVNADGRKTYVFERLDLGVGDCVYGLGERFTAFASNGQSVEIWNRDGGTATDQAYKNIPFFLTNRGWGVLVNQPERSPSRSAPSSSRRSASPSKASRWTIFVIDGPTPKDVLDRYTRLTGRPALPPAWSFGLWLTTSFTTEYDEKTVNGFIDGMRERDMPLHVFHFDCFWMRGQHWCDFEWDPAAFPIPEAMLARLKAQGLHICVWINPYIAQRSRLFDEGKAKGYLLKRPDGERLAVGPLAARHGDRRLHQSRRRATGTPDICERLVKHGRRLLQDRLRRAHPDRRRLLTTAPTRRRCTTTTPTSTTRSCSTCLKRPAARARRSCSPARRRPAASISPSTGAATALATYESMAESLRGGLSLGLSGFGFWSHDIGGFENTAPGAHLQTLVAFGLMSTHSRLHGCTSYRVPWLYDEEAVDVLRFFTKLKCRLMPYLFGAAGAGARARARR